jgi:hypothetical protein
MAIVLEFPSMRSPAARPVHEAFGGEIVFFPGVRFERLDCAIDSPDRVERRERHFGDD